jgi:hypothetical protein
MIAVFYCRDEHIQQLTGQSAVAPPSVLTTRRLLMPIMLSQAQKLELKPAAAFIQRLPEGLKVWAEIHQHLDPTIESSIRNFWPLFGISFEATLSDEPAPYTNIGLDPEVEHLIHKSIIRYLLLSALLFRIKPYIRIEADVPRSGKQTFDYKCSELVKLLAFEECLSEISLYCQTHWEGCSKNQWKERKREYQRYARGEISSSQWELLKTRWNEEDAKVFKGNPILEYQMPFTTFCFNIFLKYKQHLPEFAPFTDSLFDVDIQNKLLIVNGQLSLYPGRGKGKNPKSS